MAQIYTITIDSALLSKKDKVETLTLEEILVDNTSAPIPTLTTKDMSKLFKWLYSDLIWFTYNLFFFILIPNLFD